jgi:hypothetical protein
MKLYVWQIKAVFMGRKFTVTQIHIKRLVKSVLRDLTDRI